MAEKNKTQGRSQTRPCASSPCSMHELDADFQQFAQRDDWEAIRSWRRQQRARLTALRQSLSSSERHRFGKTICAALQNEPSFVDGTIGCYWPLNNEIDLRPLMHRLAGLGVELALPVIVEKNQPMEFWAWNTQSAMRNQPVWSIPAPVARKLLTPSILFVPLLGFDAQGHRLGHGGGYYDRTLAALAQKPLTVGIGYEFGRLETIHPQPHDVVMDVVVTEQGISQSNF